MRMQRGEYRSTERRAWGQGNVVIEDSTTTLRAPLGIYELDRQRAIFYRGVELRDSATAVTADSVVYLRRTGERTAWGNVRIVFSRERTSVEGDSAYQNPLENVAWVSGRCFLIEWDTTVNGRHAVPFGGESLYGCAIQRRSTYVHVGMSGCCVAHWQRWQTLHGSGSGIVSSWRAILPSGLILHS